MNRGDTAKFGMRTVSVLVASDSSCSQGTIASCPDVRSSSHSDFAPRRRHASADEHANGQIWSATLWDIWKAIGRRAADRVVVESHFQLDGFTTFARGARALLDADRNLYRDRHRTSLRRIFRRRGIGPVE